MRKAFLIRIEPEVLDDLQRWANDDLRSLNAQIEFILRRALTDAGRGARKKGQKSSGKGPAGETGSDG